MKRFLIVLLLVALPVSAQERTGGTARYQTVIAGGYNVKDSLLQARRDITKARDSLLALRASLNSAISTLTSLNLSTQAVLALSLRDTAAALRLKDVALRLEALDSLASHQVKLAGILSSMPLLSSDVASVSARSSAYADSFSVMRTQINYLLSSDGGGGRPDTVIPPPDTTSEVYDLESGYIVSASGSNASDGLTSATAFATIAYGISRLGKAPNGSPNTAYDTLLVRAGTYAEDIAITASGPASHNYVVKAYGSDKVLLTGTHNDVLSPVVKIEGDNWAFEGFTIQNADFYAAPFTQWLYNVELTGNNILFAGNEVSQDGDPREYFFDGAWCRGIAVGGRHVTVAGNFIRGMFMGITSDGGSDRYHWLKNNTIYASMASGVVVGGTNDNSTGFLRVVVEGGRIDTSFQEDAIQLDHGAWNSDAMPYTHAKGVLIRGVYMANCAENIVDIKGHQHTIIDSCIAVHAQGDDDGVFDMPWESGDANFLQHDAGSGAAIARGYNATGSPNANFRLILRRSIILDNMGGVDFAHDGGDHIVNNVIMNNNTDYRGPGQSLGGGFNGWIRNTAARCFMNNVVVDAHFIAWDWLMNYSNTLHLDNNLYYNPSGDAAFLYRSNSSSPGQTVVEGIQAWRTAMSTDGYEDILGKEAHSREAAPAFASVPALPTGWSTSWDFRAAQGSPLVDAGGEYCHATNASGASSTLLVVDDAYFFTDGFGVTSGDLIRIGSGAPVLVTAIDYTTNTITLESPRSWASGAPVALPWSGSAVDIGARE